MRPLVLALLAATLLAGCGGGGGGGEEEDALSAQEIVSRSADAMEETETFAFVYDVEGSEGSSSGLDIRHADGVVSRPDRLRADVNAVFSGVGIETELIVVEDETYLKDPLLGSWREVTGTLDAAAVFDPGEGVVSVMRDAQDLERVGEEDLDGTPTYHLTGMVPAESLTAILGNPATGELVPADIWVGREDFLARRIELHGPLYEDESEETERVITASDYGRPVEIERPTE